MCTDDDFMRMCVRARLCESRQACACEFENMLQPKTFIHRKVICDDAAALYTNVARHKFVRRSFFLVACTLSFFVCRVLI